MSEAERRTQAPPERRIAEVKKHDRVGAYDLIVARDAIGPANPRPGQFYMLATGAGWGGGADERPYLPRAFSFATAQPLPGGAGVDLGFLLEDVGPGTRRLCETAPGDALAIVGPLGLGFGAPIEGTRPVLVGGGIGVAPLLCLEAELLSAGIEPDVLVGFRSAECAAAAGLFSTRADLMTDDGSAGGGGLVTEPLRDLLRESPEVTVFACGPEAMLDAVRVLCDQLEVPAQLALESGMACGYGACFGCVVETRDGFARVCVDGPVFDSEVLA